MFVCVCMLCMISVCICVHVCMYLCMLFMLCVMCVCVCVCVRMFVWCVCVHDCRGKATQAGRALSSGLRKAVLREHPPENEEETSPAALSQGHSGDRAPGPAWVTDAGLHRKVSLSCFTCFQSSS